MKISEEKKAMIRSFARHNSHHETARRFGVCHATVGNVVGRKKVKRTVKEKVQDRVYFRHEDYLGGLV